MIDCERCGTAANPQDRFCGSCGEYLNWEEGTEAATAAPEPAVPATAAAPGDPAPAGPQEAPSSPQPAPTPAAPIPAAPEPPPAPVGIACRSCGTDNDTDRHFCRSCGAELREAAPPAKESWWRRWRRRRRERPAGYRRKGRRKPHVKRYVLIPLVIAAVLLLIVFLPALPVSHPLLENLRDRISDAAPVAPTSIDASSEATSAEFAFDGISNEYWAPGLEGDGVGEWVQAEFGDPVRLVYLLVSPGVSRDQEAFLAQARPKEIELRMFTADGGAETVKLTLADSAEPQTLELGVSDVTGVRLTILSTYGFEPGKAVAIAELEYFIRN